MVRSDGRGRHRFPAAVRPLPSPWVLAVGEAAFQVSGTSWTSLFSFFFACENSPAGLLCRVGLFF